MNAVTKMSPSNLATLSSVPPLSEKLSVLLLSGDSPVIGPSAATELRAWLAAIEAYGQPPTPSIDDVENVVSRLSLATKERALTVEENKERLELYWRALNDVPRADLTRAFDVLIRTSKWMPTPAEIHAEAKRHAAKRDYRISRARHLIWKHDREYIAPPADRVTPEEIAQIKRAAGIGEEVDSARGARA